MQEILCYDTGSVASTKYGILVPQPGVKPGSPEVQGRFLPLDHQEVLRDLLLYFDISLLPDLIQLSVQFSSVTQACLTLQPPAAGQASLSSTNSWSLHKLISIESVMPSNHLTLCRPLLFLPSIFPSIRVFSNDSVFHSRWPKYWSFSFNISPSSEHSLSVSVDKLPEVEL